MQHGIVGAVNRLIRGFFLPVLGVVLFLGAWWLVAISGPPGKVPTPAAVLATMIAGFRDDNLLLDLRLSVLRVLIGVVVGCAAAAPIGFLLAWFPVLRAMFDPLVNFFRALPPIALIPLVILYLGIGDSARSAILIYAAFFTAVIVIYESVAAVDDIYVRAARSMGANSWELFRRVVVPFTLPQLFVAVRVALGVCWATVVAAELIAAQRGLGWRIQRSASFFDYDMVYAGIILIGLCALVMDRVVRLVMGPMVRWQERVVR